MSKELDAFFPENTSRLEDLLGSFQEFKEKQHMKIVEKPDGGDEEKNHHQTQRVL